MESYLNENGKKIIALPVQEEIKCIYCHRNTYGKDYVVVESEGLHVKGRAHHGCAIEADERQNLFGID